MTATATARRSRSRFWVRMRPAVSDPTCLYIPRSAFTLTGFRKWVLSDEFPEKQRATFISGDIYLEVNMEELQTHGAVKAEVSRVLMNLNRESKQGMFYLDGVLVTNEDADVSNSPDGTFVSLRSLRSKRVRLVSHEGR